MPNDQDIDYSQLAKKVIPLAAKGNVKAQFQLGVLYLNGKGVPKDYKQAASWFGKSALQGYSKSQYYLGSMYYRGLGVPKDYAQAADWFGKAAEQGHPKAQEALRNIQKLKQSSELPQKDKQTAIALHKESESPPAQIEAQSQRGVFSMVLQGASFLLLVLALVVIYKICSGIASLLSGTGVAGWAVGKLIGMFLSLLIWVFFKTVLYIIPPILIYLLIQFLVGHPLLRYAAGIGSIYLFWILSGGFSFTSSMLFSPSEILDAIFRIIRLLFQIYFLAVLVLPNKLMNLIGAVASFLGGLLINSIPVGIPAVSFDDIAAMSVLTCFIMYLNTLAAFIKYVTAHGVRLTKGGE